MAYVANAVLPFSGRWVRYGMALVCLSFVAAPPGWAGEIYRSVNAQGVVSFSDVRTPGATSLALPQTPVPDAEAAAEQQQRIIDQQLQVAEALETSRLAREAAHTKRLEALAAVQPTTIVVPQTETRYVGGYSYQRRSWHPGYRPGYPGYRPGYPGYPGRPDHPGHPAHPIEPAPPAEGGHSQPSYRMRFPSSG